MSQNCAGIIWLFLVVACRPDVDEIVKNDNFSNYPLVKIILLFVTISNIESGTVFLDESML